MHKMVDKKCPKAKLVRQIFEYSHPQCSFANSEFNMHQWTRIPCLVAFEGIRRKKKFRNKL